MNANIAGFLRASAHRHPDAVCIVSGDARYSWAEVDRTADAFAAGLIQRGLHAGDRVALLLGNCYEFVIAYYGAARAGLVTVPLNPAYTSAEVAVMLADSGARMLVAQQSTEQVGDEAAAALPGCEVVSTSGPDWAGILASGESAVLAEGATSPDALALLLFTAGTSGRPKGAMLTHGALRANVEMLLALTDPPAVVDDDVVLIVLPMFHVYGLNTALGLAVAAGATCVLSDRFDPVESLSLITRNRVTTIAGAPAMYQAWCATPALREGMSTVRMLSSGGAPLPVRVFESFARAHRAGDLRGVRHDGDRAGGGDDSRVRHAEGRFGGPPAPGPGRPAGGRDRVRRRRGRSGRGLGPGAVGVHAATGRMAPAGRTRRAGSAPATWPTRTRTATSMWSTDAAR